MKLNKQEIFDFFVKAKGFDPFLINLIETVSALGGLDWQTGEDYGDLYEQVLLKALLWFDKQGIYIRVYPNNAAGDQMLYVYDYAMDHYVVAEGYNDHSSYFDSYIEALEYAIFEMIKLVGNEGNGK